MSSSQRLFPRALLTPVVTTVAALSASFTAPAAFAVEMNMAGLSGPVTVYEDALGIPTIKGESELGVVFVLGYIHARDRFFQLDRDRKGAAGRAAELLGSAALSSDVQYRNL